jgi:hypothetical protein
MEVSGRLHAPDVLLPESRSPRSHWIGGWMNTRIGPDAAEKRQFLHSQMKSYLLRDLSPRANSTDRAPPLVGEVSANFC